MYLKRNFVYVDAPKLIPGDNSLLGKTVSVGIPRDWPLETIRVRVFFTTGTALTLFPATAQTPDNFDNILNLLKHVTLKVNEGTGSGQVNKVDCDGVRLLEYNMKTRGNLDAATLNLLGLSQGTTVAANSVWQLQYDIPCSEVMIAEPLHSRLLLPVHKYTQDPVLTLTFQSLANIASAGTMPVLGATIQLIRRVVTPQSEGILQKMVASNPNSVDAFGYVRWDLLEQPFAVAATANEQKFDLALGAAYINLLFSHYLGGANMTRNVVDNAGIGDTVAHGFGAEDLWRLETAQVADMQWRWRDLMTFNDISQERNNLSQTSSPGFGGAALASTNFQAASSTMIDFLRDGNNSDTGIELGSVLDCNLNASLKKQLIGKCAIVATNPSQISVMGRRIFGDLSPWQSIQ